MKLITIFSLSLLFCLATVNAQNGYNAYNNQGAYNNQFANTQNGNVKMHPLQDPQTGMVAGHLPLPANWKVTPNKWQGPENTAVELRMGGSFSSMQRQVNSIDQILREDLLPQLQQMGVQVNNIIDLPEVARNNQQIYAQYWQAVPCQNHHQAKGIEVTDPNTGNRGFIVVHFTLSTSQYGNFAFYQMNVMEAKSHRYEQDKKAVIYALANTRPNPQFIAAHNQREQQKSNASWAAHNNRMRQNQSNFDSFQQTQQTYSDISDMSHESWQRRNQMNNAGHDKTINGVWERDAMVNPYSNQQMNVQSGYKYYYMNQNGQYFGTNNANYNPAQDPNMNHMEWRKVQAPKGNGNGY
jgi:hypothetical protein